jgi:hypothetical protein
MCPVGVGICAGLAGLGQLGLSLDVFFRGQVGVVDGLLRVILLTFKNVV